jgi:hypothetical protein
MSDPLAVYLHDHLAGSNFAIELLESMRDQHDTHGIRKFAADLLVDIQADQAVLQQIIDRVGKAGMDLKQAAAWFAEKASRLKLRSDGDNSGGLGTFEALETLSLGITGKLALWRALELLSVADERVRGVDYTKLIARAKEQYAQAEERRLQLAATVFHAVAAT